MAKRAARRQRGLQRGAGKHKIRAKTVSQVGDDRPGKYRNSRKLLGISVGQYYKTGQASFDFVFRCCEKFCLIPFKRNSQTGEYELLKAKSCYYIALSLYAFHLFRIAAAAVHTLMERDFDLESCMAISSLLLYFVPTCVALGMWSKPEETVDLMNRELNRWKYALACLESLGHGGQRPLNNLSTALKVCTVLFLCQGIATTPSIMFALYFTNLPHHWLPTLAKLELVPVKSLPYFAWQLLFAPLEFLTYLPPLLIGPLSFAILIISLGVSKMYVDAVREFSVHSLEDRERVEQLYICLELYFRILRAWVRFMLPPTIFGLSCGLIIMVFVSLRFTTLAFFLYICFPSTAVTIMFLLFWIIYDMELTQRASEDVRSRLLARGSHDLRGLLKTGTIQRMIRRAKAMGQVSFPIGEFGEVSLSLGIDIWEECLNQVVFLLSL